MLTVIDNQIGRYLIKKSLVINKEVERGVLPNISVSSNVYSKKDNQQLCTLYKYNIV